MYIEYGEREIEYLKSKDKRLAEVIDRVGHVYREVEGNLFTAVVHHIAAQQISGKALDTLWQRMNDGLGEINAETLIKAGRDKIQAFGMSYRKADYILDFAAKVYSGEFDIAAVEAMTDEEVIAALTELKGIGVWTAEMILLFALERPNVLSYGDYGIQRGMRMVYRHRKITRDQFERYRRRLSPYCSVASLYFWAVSGGAIPELTDPGAKRKK